MNCIEFAVYLPHLTERRIMFYKHIFNICPQVVLLEDRYCARVRSSVAYRICHRRVEACH